MWERQRVCLWCEVSRFAACFFVVLIFFFFLIILWLSEIRQGWFSKTEQEWWSQVILFWDRNLLKAIENLLKLQHIQLCKKTPKWWENPRVHLGNCFKKWVSKKIAIFFQNQVYNFIRKKLVKPVPQSIGKEPIHTWKNI